MASGSSRFAANASTWSVLQSSSALHISLAPQAPTAGSSAKVEPPLSGHLPVRASPSCLACAGVPSSVAGIAAQPLPHESGTVELSQAAVWREIAPVRLSPLARFHRTKLLGNRECDANVTQITLFPILVLIGFKIRRNAECGGNEGPKQSRPKAERTARRVLAA